MARDSLRFRSHLVTSVNMVPTPKTHIRIDREQIERIDALRGMVARERYIRWLLDKALKAEERKAAKK